MSEVISEVEEDKITDPSVKKSFDRSRLPDPNQILPSIWSKKPDEIFYLPDDLKRIANIALLENGTPLGENSKEFIEKVKRGIPPSPTLFGTKVSVFKQDSYVSIDGMAEKLAYVIKDGTQNAASFNGSTRPTYLDAYFDDLKRFLFFDGYCDTSGKHHELDTPQRPLHLWKKVGSFYLKDAFIDTPDPAYGISPALDVYFESSLEGLKAIDKRPDYSIREPVNVLKGSLGTDYFSLMSEEAIPFGFLLPSGTIELLGEKIKLYDAVHARVIVPKAFAIVRENVVEGLPYFSKQKT